MKILLSGVGGFIGSNVFNRMFDLQFADTVYGFDNLKFGTFDNITKRSKDYNVFEKEISQVSDTFLNMFDILIHIACDNIIYAQDHPIETFKTNALDSIKMIEKFKGRVIYTSTSSIYGNASQIPTPEYCPDDVSNAYDQSKLIFERYLKLRGNYTTLRLSNVYGPNQRPDNEYCGVVAKFVDTALDGNYAINIRGDGVSTRDYTYVDDVIDAIIKCCELPSQNTEINIGTSIETSTAILTILISNLINKEIRHTYSEPRKIDIINRRCLDINKAKELLNWGPKTPLKEGLRKTIDWIKANYY